MMETLEFFDDFDFKSLKDLKLDSKFRSSTPIDENFNNLDQTPIDLKNFTEEECKTILNVLDKDKELRELEEIRLK